MYAWMLHTGLNGAHYEQCLLVFKNKMDTIGHTMPIDAMKA